MSRIPENILLTLDFSSQQKNMQTLLGKSKNFYGRRMGKIGPRILEISKVNISSLEAKVLPIKNDVLPAWKNLKFYQE